MNRYKIVSIVLAVALITCIGRQIVTSTHDTAPAATPDTAAIVLDNILSRKSVRAYNDRPVSREQIDTLIRAAMAAPTGRDMRPWKFIVVDEKDAMARLAEQLPYAKMLKQAQAAILVCGDMEVKDDEGKPSANWTFDCSAATQNLLLQAEAMGLGAVWTGVYPYEERLQAVASALQLPAHIIPLNLIPIGYPEGHPQAKDKYNTDNIHYNGW